MGLVVNPNFKNNGEFHKNLITKGKGTKDYPNSHTEVEYLGKGKFAASIGVGHRVFFDKIDGDKPKKHKLTDERLNGKDYVLVQSGKFAIEIYPFYSKFFDPNHEKVRLYEERWIVQRWRDPPGKWQDIGAWNPIIATEKTDSGVTVTINYTTDYGPFTVKYIQRNGTPLKHDILFTNTSGSTETFRVVQAWAGIVGDKCNGQDFPLVTEDGYLAFHNSDKPKGKFNIAENLHTMMFNPDGSEKTDHCLQKPISIETHAQGMKTNFIYGDWVLAQDEELKIDPSTVTLDDPTEDGYIYEAFHDKTSTDLIMGNHVVPERHFRSYIEWDISSIPDGSTITDTVFKYHGLVRDLDCHIHEMLGYQPSLGDTGSIYNEAGEGTVYAAPVGFPQVGTNKQVDLGNTADSDLQNQLTVDWFAIGLQADNEELNDDDGRIYSENKSGVTPPPTLYVEYSFGFEYVGTGSFTYSGTAIIIIGFICAGSGELTYSGTATQTYTKNYLTITSGQLAFSGTAGQIYSKDYLFEGSGELAYSGEAEQSYTYNFSYVASGNFITSGSGICQYEIPDWEYVGSGVFVYSGKAFHRWGDWVEIAKGTSDFIGVGKGGSSWTKVEKLGDGWKKTGKE